MGLLVAGERGQRGRRGYPAQCRLAGVSAGWPQRPPHLAVGRGGQKLGGEYRIGRGRFA
jgi:hypothetical protein